MFKIITNILRKGLSRVEEGLMKFLGAVFSGETGEFLQDNHNLINEIVEQVEQMAAATINVNKLQAAEVILEKTGYAVSESVIEKIKNGGIAKSEAKRELARAMIVGQLEQLGKKIVMHAINVGIELAVAKLNK